MSITSRKYNDKKNYYYMYSNSKDMISNKNKLKFSFR